MSLALRNPDVVPRVTVVNNSQDPINVNVGSGPDAPVLILDEAENLYRVGVSRPERRTALRSLAHYCGGALLRAVLKRAM